MASHSLQQEKGNHGDDTKNIVLKKGKWLPEEDALLRDYVEKYGAKKWDKVREKIKLNRDGKSCRFRWLNSLKPSLKRDPFSEEEIQKLVRLYCELGPKWSQMVSQNNNLLH
ncbi:transcription factor MYB114-like [Vicia villosa]|uniref:transcription factor MYB114-like n=1 Tax=Vicia villosa TaxID=3911 RepID=UPI00273A8713|nr:transcription factor MYB114-like [Vicia villosa]